MAEENSELNLRHLSWGLGLASMLILSLTSHNLFGLTQFVIMMFVITLGMVFTFRSLNKLGALALILICEIGLFFIAFILRIMPYLGHLGDYVLFLQKVLLWTMLVSVLLLLYLRKTRLRRWRFSHLIIAVQLVLITGQFVVFGASHFLPRWQARGLDVTIIRVNNGSMCPPLIEGDIAFMAQYQMYEGGVIYQINMSTGEIIREISLPTFTPEQLGHPDWLDDGTALRVHQAVITRRDGNTLQLQYPTEFYTADWTARVDIPLSVRLTVDLVQGLVVNWEKFEGEESQAGFEPNPDYFRQIAPRQVQVGLYSVLWADAKLYFESPANCYLLRCGWPSWMLAVDDSTLLMDQTGYIYIIKVKEVS